MRVSISIEMEIDPTLYGDMGDMSDLEIIATLREDADLLLDNALWEIKRDAVEGEP